MPRNRAGEAPGNGAGGLDLLGERIPANPEAELAILGALLADPAGDEARRIAAMRHEAFASPGLRKIFAVLSGYVLDARPVDVQLLRLELERREMLHEVGGVARLVEIAEAAPAAENVQAYAKLVEDCATRRAAVEAGVKIALDACRSDDEPSALLERVRARVERVEATRPASTPTGWRFLSFRELARAPRPPFVVRDLVTAGSRVVVHGEPKRTLKTFVLLDLSLAIATGRDFLGYAIDRPGPVVYVSGEEPRWRLQERLEGLARARGVTDAAPAVLLADEGVPRVRIDLAEHVIRLTSIVREVGAVALVLEPLRRVFDGDENDSGELGAALNRLTELTRQTGACVFLSHHVSKAGATGGAALRGSSDIRSWYDLGVSLTRRGESVRAEIESRDVDVESFAFALRGRDDADGERMLWLDRVEVGEGDDERQAELEAKIAAVLAKGSLTRSKVAEEVGGRKADVLVAIKLMVEAGRLVDLGGPVSLVPGTKPEPGTGAVPGSPSLKGGNREPSETPGARSGTGNRARGGK